MDQQTQIRIGFTINLLIDQIGAVFFATLIYVIIKYKNLRKQHCLKLIGIFMFCNLFSKFIIWLPYLTRVVPLVNMPMLVCCGWFFLMMTPVTGQLPISALISFDRAISMYFPVWYANPAGKKFYFFFLCTLFILYPATNAIFYVTIAVQRTFQLTTCTGDDLGHFNSIDFPFIYATVGCYILMFGRLLISTNDRKSYLKKQPLFKAITLLLAIQVVGWLMVKYSYKLVPKLFNDATENSQPLLFYALNCFSSITTTAEFFAIYTTSSEHRKALKAEFPRLYYYFPNNILNKSTQSTRVVQLENNHATNPMKYNNTTVATI